uniref:Uncharacterized protein n=1 Tax=Arundo donax TaxID=35708 RepID=A0A0A9GIN0_ARUDO
MCRREQPSFLLLLCHIGCRLGDQHRIMVPRRLDGRRPRELPPHTMFYAVIWVRLTAIGVLVETALMLFVQTNTDSSE